MRKMIVATLILALIITAWNIESRAVDKICSEMIQSIEKLKEADTEKIKELTAALDAKWQDKEKILDVLTPHEDTDEINVDWAYFTSCVRAENYSAAMLMLDEMYEHFDEISKKSKVNIQNIF